MAVLAASLLLLMKWKVPRWHFPFAARTGWAMLSIGLLPIVLRLALLARSPAPIPTGADDFGYILLADTLRHFRLANPPHALPAFLEQIFVLQRPAFASMFPLGNGLALAAGWLLFGTPWAGVLLATGAFCALCYWMLRGWTTPDFAFAGGLLAAMQFGPLCYWMNCYWGGAISAIAGCLAFGALPRLVANRRLRHGVLLGLGLALQLLTRPFEFFLLLGGVLLFFARSPLRDRLLLKPLLAALPVIASAGALVLAQNKAVTGNSTSLPYTLYRYRYGVPATFTFQPNPVPHQALNSEQELDYRAETAIHGDGETPRAYLERLLFRMRFLRFFAFAPLYLALAASLARFRSGRSTWLLATLLLFALAGNFYPYFYPHYAAAIACLILLAAVTGLERLGPRAATLIFCLCSLQFLFWFGVHAFAKGNLYASLARFESWDYINSGDPQGRLFVDRQLARQPGDQIVFVRYGPTHAFQEWIHNAADIDASRTIWVHDLGAVENQELLRDCPDRTAWLLEPDQTPPRLTPYKRQSGPFVDVQ